MIPFESMHMETKLTVRKLLAAPYFRPIAKISPAAARRSNAPKDVFLLPVVNTGNNLPMTSFALLLSGLATDTRSFCWNEVDMKVFVDLSDALGF